MKWSVTFFIKRIWICADHQKSLYQLWKWKLTDGISPDKSRFTVTGEMERSST
jgi:hypothetical protein